jgi:hypothetical protein
MEGRVKEVKASRGQGGGGGASKIGVSAQKQNCRALSGHGGWEDLQGGRGRRGGSGASDAAETRGGLKTRF